jgi:predicted ATPase
MAVEDEVRRLGKKWAGGGGPGWPRRLEWLNVKGLRGWKDYRVNLRFPIVALVGENGSGKSTLLQAAACAYQAEEGGRTWFPSEFFPDTHWDHAQGVSIEYGYSLAGRHSEGSLRKRTTRWLGHVERPRRVVEYIDLNRLQPVAARVGYARIAKTKHTEVSESAKKFDGGQVQRLSAIMGRPYDSARMALSSIDADRQIPVISRNGTEYSGYHQGSGETTVTELLQANLPKYGLVLIDEVESSLHPRAQRRLIRDLAEECRQREFQLILTTHSPYVLDELPPEARMYIIDVDGNKSVVSGVSPQFAMTKMDDDVHPECDLYVEDVAAKVMLEEVLAYHGKEVFTRCVIVPYGTANVGHALGMMVEKKRWHRPTVVYLDGDGGEADGCVLLPGNDAPERVVFKDLKVKKWAAVWTHVARDIDSVAEACNKAMLLSDHHEWTRDAAQKLMCARETLWHAMCIEWAKGLDPQQAKRIIDPIVDALP